ncbi:efflux RND transporter periplasmic adaptor subunit [Desulfosoma caldarium]|uniref:HlyD family secretion protein n=1 Tax=Desulfosoma caldarium TaxID=610254 RepID=A0A3N1VT00_9BACT|nr:efflux RND transporter periplasmic adaptor subunit [Desulfosoma caldarium]ROR03332.1 HlyD family secretion protein [Desulfosoma caldarium]
MRKAIAVLVVLGLVTAGVLGYRRWRAPAAVQVLETAVVEKATIREVLVATGMIKSQVGALIKVGSRATGVIDEMRVRVGDSVRKGDLIARIDDREIQKTLAVDRAVLEAARNILKEVTTVYPEKIREAQARFRLAQVNLRREKALIEQDYTTRDAVDRAQAEHDAAQAALERLRREYVTQRAVAEAKLREAEAKLKQDEIRLSYTRIHAPIDGIVTEVTAQQGETIVTGLQTVNLVVIMDPTQLEMQIYVDETDVGRVRVGQTVEYSVDTYPDRTFVGTIKDIYHQPVIRDNIVYYLAIVKIQPEDARALRPEMTTYCRILLTEKAEALSVPNAAIKFEAGRQVVYIISEDQKMPQKVPVSVGIRGENRTEIVSGLNEGQVVATKIIVTQGQNGPGSQKR